MQVSYPGNESGLPVPTEKRKLLIGIGTRRPRKREGQSACSEAIARLEQRTGSSIGYPLAVALLGIRERDRALAHLREAMHDRSERIVDAGIDPRLQSLHGDAEFRRIVGAVGFVG
jgi:hypothetical protein